MNLACVRPVIACSPRRIRYYNVTGKWRWIQVPESNYAWWYTAKCTKFDSLGKRKIWQESEGWTYNIYWPDGFQDWLFCCLHLRVHDIVNAWVFLQLGNNGSSYIPSFVPAEPGSSSPVRGSTAAITLRRGYNTAYLSRNLLKWKSGRASTLIYESLRKCARLRTTCCCQI